MTRHLIAVALGSLLALGTGLAADVPDKVAASGSRQGDSPATQPAPPPHEPGKVRGVLPRDAAADPRLIDLAPHYTLGLDEDASGAFGYTLSALPGGVHKLDQTTYDLRGIVQLSGKEFVAIGKAFPQSVTGIKVAQKAQKLCFLHASRWIEDEGVQIAIYVIHYADGQTQEVPIRFGVELRDWKPQHDPRAGGAGPPVGWKGKDAHGGDIVLFELAWTNPRADVEIQTIDLVSMMKDAAPFVVAITAQ